jgi:hypothetical protein
MARLCWNLVAEPLPYLMKLSPYRQKNGLDSEIGWYERAIAARAT